MADRHVIVLAAGKGTRMRAARPKVLHRIGSRTLIDRVLDAARPLDPVTQTVVVGHQAASVEAAVGARHPEVQCVLQQPQLGTAHALSQAQRLLAHREGTLLVLSGDVPCLRSETLATLVETHEKVAAAATMLTAEVEQPFGYGRVIRRDGAFAGVVEEADATPAERAIREINSGVYVFELGPLFETLHQIPEAGPKHERYLPAVLGLYRERGLTVTTVRAPDPQEIRGVNSQAELADMTALIRHRKNAELMAAGVTIEDPATTYIDDEVQVGPDTVIHPGVTLEGQTIVGARCELHWGTRLVDSTVEDGVTVHNCCVIIKARLGAGTQVGPFAHLRPGSVLLTDAKVGNFVELKQSTLGPGSKANHLTYLGDTTVGANVNVGAGTITCNYDGRAKHPTTVEDDVFIGSGTELVAPVTIGRGSYVAAGSCVTEDVPPGALAIARGRQVNKTGWADRKKPKR